MSDALEATAGQIVHSRRELSLPTASSAWRGTQQIHAREHGRAEQARERLAFDELRCSSWASCQAKRVAPRAGWPCTWTGVPSTFVGDCRSPDEAQQGRSSRSCRTVAAGADGRLLQGDVGSGKAAVPSRHVAMTSAVSGSAHGAH